MSKELIDLADQYKELHEAWVEMEKENKSVLGLQDSLKYLEKGKDEYFLKIQNLQSKFDDASVALQDAVNENMENNETIMNEVSENFEHFRNQFNIYKVSYQADMTSMISHLDDKINTMKASNLTQRIIILDIFYQYCDALFYQTFTKCHQINIDMSGSFSSILEELRKLQWQISTFQNKLPQSPAKFAKHAAIIENDFVYPQPIQKLKENKYVTIDKSVPKIYFESNFLSLDQFLSI